MIATQTCGRCNGTGKHSFNLRDGDVCYGCGGSGLVAMAPKGQKKVKATAETRKAIIGDIILVNKVLYTVAQITWCKLNDEGNQKIRAIRLVDNKAFRLYRAALDETNTWITPTDDMIGKDI